MEFLTATRGSCAKSSRYLFYSGWLAIIFTPFLCLEARGIVESFLLSYSIAVFKEVRKFLFLYPVNIWYNSKYAESVGIFLLTWRKCCVRRGSGIISVAQLVQCMHAKGNFRIFLHLVKEVLLFFYKSISSRFRNKVCWNSKTLKLRLKGTWS